MSVLLVDHTLQVLDIISENPDPLFGIFIYDILNFI
ncbi:MAG: hypothetical protein HW380_381 [Magnetococcales bacterium]|nr:hypothetical protein [Magnetococcales bacterium]